MLRDQGRISYLSYGWIGDELSQAGTPLEAQQALADQILALVNKPAGSRVLDIGCGAGQLLLALSERGFEVHGIDNNAQSVAMARNTVLASEFVAEVTHVDFAQAWQSMEAGYFDVIIFQNSFRYFPTSLVFAAGLHLLAPGGRLIISEEFDVEHAENRKLRELPALDYTLAEAERNGLQLSRRMDLSEGVIRFMHDFSACLDRQAPGMIADHVMSEATWLEVQQGIQHDLAAMQQGNRSHQLLQFDMSSYDPDRVTERPLIIPAELKLSTDYAALFEVCFDSPFCAQLWQWKYGGGRGASVAALKEGRVVAHYGGMVRAIEYFGSPESAVQIGDVMVLPKERGFFSRSGLFFRTATAMLEQHTGYSARHLLGFGFPNIKAMHVAQRLKLYQKTDDLVSLSLKPEAEQQITEMALPVQVRDWSTVEDDFINHVWERMKSSLTDGIVGVRDAGYVRFRYQHRPGQDYQLLAVGEKEKTPGLLIYRRHGEQEMVMDVIAAASDVPAVLQAGMQYVQHQDREMFCWLTRGQLQRLSTESFLVADTAIQIPCNAWSRGPDAETLKGAWWLTAGDTDFL